MNIHIKLWVFQREWNRIAVVLISVYTVNKCNPFSTYCISGVVFVEPSGVHVLKNPNPLKDVEASVMLDVVVLV